MYQTDIDYFIIENKAIRLEYSEKIKNYFIKKKETCNNIVGYIQFEKNIAANAINIFIKKYGDFLKKYEYVTFTDGDYYVYDIKSTIREILMGFNHHDCAISSADLYLNNLVTTLNRIIGTNYYDDFMRNRDGMNLGNVVGIGIPSLMTLQKKDLYILESIYYYDGNIRNKVSEIGKRWYITVKNLTYCLTHDIFYPGNEYHEWKKKIGPKIWQITEESNYIEIIKT
jgi:hypothetical protein